MEKKYKIGLWINMVLTLIALVAVVQCLIKGKYIVGSIVDIIVIGAVTYYAFVGYKKPHGNLLKQIMLLFGASLVISELTAAKYGDMTTTVILPIAMMIIAYISGRLNRVKENAILMVIVLFNLAHSTIGSVIRSGGTRGFSTNHMTLYPFIIWIVLCGAYFTRYKQHQEAGLEDNK